MRRERRFSILDVTVSVSGDAADLAYVEAFVDAYTPMPPPSQEPRVQVEVTRELPDGIHPSVDPTRLWVHRSKHPYWNLRGVGAPGAVRWVARPVDTVVDGLRVRVSTPASASPEVTGEAGWHVCRSVALYARDPRAGKLLHASAVAIAGKAVLFVGDVSAGKTTLMTEAVVAHGAVPLANDRVLIRTGDRPTAVSWPSYASFTEGTLLDYEALGAAALAYEAGETGHRTQTWGPALRRLYTKEAKRIFPMRWLSDALGRAYRREAPLAGVIVSAIAPRMANPGVTRISLADAGARAALADLVERESFDAVEPSFCPWHGLTLPTGAMSARELVASLDRAAVPILALRAPAPGFDAHLERALEELA